MSSRVGLWGKSNRRGGVEGAVKDVRHENGGRPPAKRTGEGWEDWCTRTLIHRGKGAGSAQTKRFVRPDKKKEKVGRTTSSKAGEINTASQRKRGAVRGEGKPQGGKGLI